MNVKELGFSKKVEDILSKDVPKLNPPQKMAVNSGLLEGKNIVVASPTASGKTFIGEMALVKNFLKGGKTVYLVPLKALASEKYHDFKEKYTSLGMKINISVGDLDRDESRLAAYDVIIASNEKFDSILRKRPLWVSEINLVVVDEIHVIGDLTRGPTLEIVLTKLMQETNAQIIALSATIQNSNDISKWLNAELVKSDYRPVKLMKGTYFKNTAYFEEKKIEFKNNFDDEFSICKDTLDAGKQSILFMSSRRSAESEAEKLSKMFEINNKELDNVAGKIEKILDSPTMQCSKLSNLVRKGVAFHHAGLVDKQKKLIEDNFKNGNIKFITATPTLAFGVNLPAYRVIIRDYRRFNGYGMDYIPSIEIHQMFGRAGRPKYDKHGEGIIITKSEAENEKVYEMYIKNGTENIYSKLSVGHALRTHILGLIASGFCKSRNEIESFFSNTLFSCQYDDLQEVMRRVDDIISYLADCGFIEKNNSREFVSASSLNSDVEFKPTLIGKKVSDLYIDPESAQTIIDRASKNSVIDIFLTLNKCVEMRPGMRASYKEMKSLEDMMDEYEMQPDHSDYDRFMSEFKTSLMLMGWVNEKSENNLNQYFGVLPGELQSRTKNGEWIAYSASEICRILGNLKMHKAFRDMSLRIRHGIKADLMNLIVLRGIGRVRARKLYNSGIKRRIDIKKSKLEKLEKILGKTVAKNIKTAVS